MTPDAAAPTLTDPPGPAPIGGDLAAQVAPPAGNRPANNGPSIGQRATHGLMWGTLASIVAKVIGFGQLIGLAYFLDVKDFGLLTMATTVAAFGTVPLRVGLEEILIQRGRHIHLWAGPAFWISVFTGLGTMLLLFALAPVAAWFYGDTRVAWLIVVLALATPLTAVTAVPFAMLSIGLRFREGSFLGMIVMFVTAGVAIPLAAAGAGPYSIPIASLAAAATSLAYGWSRARMGPIGPPKFKRWRYFLRDAGMLQGMRWSMAVASNVDFIVLGRFAGAGSLGTYSYAYNQSLQAMRMIAANAAGVLFPSLSNFDDDDRKYAAFCRGLRLALPVMVPACILQAALADPGFRMLFRAEYWPGIPLFQILSFGTIGVGAVTLTYSFIMSLRRNGLGFANAAGSAGMYLAVVPIGYGLGGVTGVAWASMLVATLSMIYAHWLAARAVSQPVGPALALYLTPTLLGLLSCALPWAIVTFALPPGHAAWLRVFVGGATFVLCYVPLLRWLAPETFAEIVRRLPSRVRRVLG